MKQGWVSVQLSVPLSVATRLSCEMCAACDALSVLPMTLFLATAK
jgi:hypothetical protein